MMMPTKGTAVAIDDADGIRPFIGLGFGFASSGRDPDAYLASLDRLLGGDPRLQNRSCHVGQIYHRVSPRMRRRLKGRRQRTGNVTAYSPNRSSQAA